MRVFPVDGARLVHLHVLARLDTPPTKDALLRIITIKGIRMIFFVRFGPVRDGLMLDG